MKHFAMKVADVRSTIRSAFERNDLIRIRRSRLEAGWINCYVIGMGEEFFGALVVDPSIFFNGVNYLMYHDIDNIECPAPHSAFVERALSLKNEIKPLLKDVDWGTLCSVATCAARHFGLITVHAERRDPSVCYIGELTKISKISLTIRPIYPDATWSKRLRRFDIEDVTRLDFGGSYENALALVANASQRVSQKRLNK